MGDATPGERLVQGRIAAALPSGARLYRNVHWLAPGHPGGPARDGEIDALVVHPLHGILVIEVKDGQISRDGFGRWYAGGRALKESPFEQAARSKYVIRDKICARPDWPGEPPRMLHAVAFPDVDRSSLPAGTHALGPDAPLDLVIDGRDLETPESTARALDRVFAFWAGQGVHAHTLDDRQLAIVADVLEPEIRFRRLLRDEIEEGARELLAPTHHQLGVLKTLRGRRRASIAGGAGSGKTLVAIEKARQLAADRFRVLFVCFNSPLAAAVAREPALAPAIEAGFLTVSTFHELCLRLGHEAGVLPPTPDHPDSQWFSQTLPAGLYAAIPKIEHRWNALVVDEGQDLDGEWLLALDELLAAPGEGVFYLFHDPAQSLYRPDATAALGLEEFALADNCRNPKPVHEFAYRWYTGDDRPEPMREDGREPEIVVAAPGEPTLEAVRSVLHRLVHEERVDRRRIAVLTGVSLEHSAVWQHHRFKGDLTLWNGSVNRDGRSLALPADRVPLQPFDTILCETIHRFKGLEADVVVLVELRVDDPRLGMLLYIGASRARQHLVVVAAEGVGECVRQINQSRRRGDE